MDVEKARLWRGEQQALLGGDQGQQQPADCISWRTASGTDWDKRLSRLLSLAIAILGARIVWQALQWHMREPVSFTCPQGQARALSNISLGWREPHARTWAIERLQAAVRIPTVSRDDGIVPGPDDPVWRNFDEIKAWLQTAFPTLFDRAHVETFGFLPYAQYTHLWTLKGSDASLKPILLTGHIDVVPADNEELWTYPPWDAHIDSKGWMWGRGVVDNKGGIISIISAVENLLSKGWTPTRTLIVVAHANEEVRGPDAKLTAAKLLERYGENGIEVALDEGTGSGGIVYGRNVEMIGIAEKGYGDLSINVTVFGGHSGSPKQTTAIGVMSDIVEAYGKAKRLIPSLKPDHPAVQQSVCFAEHGLGDEPKKLRKAIRSKDLETLKAFVDPLLTTTTAVATVFKGGSAKNVIPPVAYAYFNHRTDCQTTLAQLTDWLRDIIAPVAKKHGLTLGKEVKVHFDDAWDAIKIASTESKAYNAIVSIGRGVWEDKLFVPSSVLGATDGRKYETVAENVYRFSPVSGFPRAAHTTDEKMEIEAFVRALQFYTEFILYHQEV